MRLNALRVLHPFPSLLVSGLTMALVPLADRGAPIERYAVLGGGMAMFQFAIGVTNDLADTEADAATKPWKPLARGDLTRGAASMLALGLAGGGLLLTLTLPLAAWLVGAAGLACGLVYDLWLKRTSLSWLPFSVALPLVPIWVYTAAERWSAGLWWALPLGATLGLALHLANQAPDAAGGAREGLPGRLGERASRITSVVLFTGVAAAVTARAAGVDARLGVLAAGLALATVAASARAQVFGRDGLFGVLAAGGAGLALLFLVSI